MGFSKRIEMRNWINWKSMQNAVLQLLIRFEKSSTSSKSLQLKLLIICTIRLTLKAIYGLRSKIFQYVSIIYIYKWK